MGVGFVRGSVVSKCMVYVFLPELHVWTSSSTSPGSTYALEPTVALGSRHDSSSSNS